MRVAAVQLRPALGDVAANLAACEPLVGQAVAAGAEVVVLPEFFTTGMAYLPAIRAGVEPAGGRAQTWLRSTAARHGVVLGGSLLLCDPDGDVRNAFLLCGPDGALLGRHDKDLATMWEAAFYVGGDDDGVLALPDGTRVGVALCWELMRTQTVRRLRGRVDVVLGGSAWWSVPPWPPAAVTRRLEARNAETARRATRTFARYVGAPVVHASQAGPLACRMLGMGLAYRGEYEGPTGVYDASGGVLAERAAREGPGVVVADVAPGARTPSLEPGDGFWLHRRGALPAFAWTWQRALGAREYARMRA